MHLYNPVHVLDKGNRKSGITNKSIFVADSMKFNLLCIHVVKHRHRLESRIASMSCTYHNHVTFARDLENYIIKFICLWLENYLPSYLNELLQESKSPHDDFGHIS